MNVTTRPAGQLPVAGISIEKVKSSPRRKRSGFGLQSSSHWHRSKNNYNNNRNSNTTRRITYNIYVMTSRLGNNIVCCMFESNGIKHNFLSPRGFAVNDGISVADVQYLYKIYWKYAVRVCQHVPFGTSLCGLYTVVTVTVRWKT